MHEFNIQSYTINYNTNNLHTHTQQLQDEDIYTENGSSTKWQYAILVK